MRGLRPRIDGLVVRANRWLLEGTMVLDGAEVVVRAEGADRVEQPDPDDGWLACLVRRRGDFIDIGCSAGLVSLTAMAVDPYRRLLAIDANSRALQVCAQNLIANGWSERATFVVGFMGDTGDGAWVPTPSAIDPGFPPHAETAIPRRRLDDLVADLGLTPELVKIDVEGGESGVLEGARQTAQVASPWFHVEMHSTDDLTMADNGAAVLGWCVETGYAAWYLKEHRQVTEAAAFADRGRCHLLLLPQGTSYPDGLSSIAQGATVAEGLAGCR
jgi:FkbM family methyltransferase